MAHQGVGELEIRMRLNDLLFMHWPIQAHALRELIPPRLKIDTYGGQAWIGIVALRLTGVRLKHLPPLPRMSSFPELNVCTYVQAAEKPGVWFFSLDVPNPGVVRLARWLFDLPYWVARTSFVRRDDQVHFHSRRIHRGAPPAELRVRYRPTGDIYEAAQGTLDHWLTERYYLYTVDRANRIRRGVIHHGPWRLQPAEAAIETNTMTAPLGIQLPESVPRLHFARGVDAVVQTPKTES